MAKNFVQRGENITVLAASIAVSGELVVMGSLFGVALHDAAANDELTLKTGGVWELPKTSANEPAAGDPAYWDADVSEITTTATDNTKVGVFTEAAANGDTTCRVRLNDAF
jgi:predicted RecA/RadA family phage recombinase